MKRRWIFFALILAFSAFAPTTQATPVSQVEIALLEAPPGCMPWHLVRRVIRKCAQQTNFNFGQLVHKYFHNKLLIERLDEHTIQVTIFRASGNPITVILQDNF